MKDGEGEVVLEGRDAKEVELELGKDDEDAKSEARAPESARQIESDWEARTAPCSGWSAPSGADTELVMVVVKIMLSSSNSESGSAVPVPVASEKEASFAAERDDDRDPDDEVVPVVDSSNETLGVGSRLTSGSIIFGKTTAVCPGASS
jgi:hypothetical protein